MDSRETVALVSRLNAFLFQLELLKRCDPEAVVVSPLRRSLKLNCLMVAYLRDRLEVHVKEQNRTEADYALYSLGLALTSACREAGRCWQLLEEFERNRDKRAFFRGAMGLDVPCPYHVETELRAYGDVRVTKQLSTVNDAENLLKQVNYIHAVVPEAAAAELFARIDDFFSETLANGPVAAFEAYDESAPCAVCFEELCVTANQGQSVYKRLADRVCDHLATRYQVHVDEDDLLKNLPYAGGHAPQRLNALCEDLRHARHEAQDERQKAENGCGATESAVMDETERLLNSFDVFCNVPPAVYKMSELKFWLLAGSGDETAIDLYGRRLADLEEKDALLARQEALTSLRLFGVRLTHFHDLFPPADPMEKVAVGSPRLPPETRMVALINAFYARAADVPLFRRLRETGERNTEALRKVLVQIQSGETAEGESDDGRETAVGESFRSQNESLRDLEELERRVRGETEERKRAYAARLSRRSFLNLSKCVEKQRAFLDKMLSVNVWGQFLLEAAVRTRNGFSRRARFLERVTGFGGEVRDKRHCRTDYDARQFVRNALLRHEVDPALLSELVNRFYELINGPYFTHAYHVFAQPHNTPLYFSVENVGLLPHIKNELASFMLIRNHREWMVSEYKEFYKFPPVCDPEKTGALNDLQRLAWRYVRELVLASALFHAAFGRDHVLIKRADLSFGKEEDGLYLTYETECPLVVVLGARDGRLVPGESLVALETDLYSAFDTVLRYRRERDHAPSPAL
uniref:UL28 n=1 Tax=Fibropapilloma-associated turtle herpesvirus TaxID=256817 RepID=Q5Y968_9ALPH|nr:UL28 [Fibropapilloma-associated turtle herpesvirus]